MTRTHPPPRSPQGKYARTGYTSPIDAALEVIGGKYKVTILYHLRASVVRFGELRRLMPVVTQRMLTKQLRELERDGILRRKVFRQVPPRVDYMLTQEGRSVVPILEALCEWGKRRIGPSTQVPISGQPVRTRPLPS
jgi:DNA-binding HxlR family transcriptional regulator